MVWQTPHEHQLLNIAALAEGGEDWDSLFLFLQLHGQDLELGEKSRQTSCCRKKSKGTQPMCVRGLQNPHVSLLAPGTDFTRGGEWPGLRGVCKGDGEGLLWGHGVTGHGGIHTDREEV